MEDHTDDDAPERKPFALALQEMRKGGLHTELGDELAELVKQCVATGKKGSLILTLTIDPKDATNEESMLVVDDKIVVKAPRFDTAATLFWADDKGNLQRDRPSQGRLPLREVTGGTTSDDQRDTALAEEKR
jgi:hypothetical protein